MNKHLSFFIELLFLGFVQLVASQEIKQETTKYEINEAQPKFRHWSIGINRGISILDADLSGANKIIPNSKINCAFNTQLEYMINPIWGLYIQYSYLPYSGIRQNIEKFQGVIHDATLNGTFNILNLFRSNRSLKTKWCFNVNIGAGISFYTTNLYNGENYNTIIEQPSDAKQYSGSTCVIPKNYRSFTLPISLTIEYAPIECLGIFIQTEYRMYQTDNIDCRVQGHNNDYMGYAGFGMRYKIAANKKHNSIKTVSIMAHNPDETDRTVKILKKEVAELSTKIDNLTNIINKSHP